MIAACILAAACAAAASEGEAEAEAGMQDDGRIPLGLRPDWVEQPERWRYVPDNRLLGGPPWQRLFVSSFIVPLVSFEEATGTGFGFGIVDTEPFETRRRNAYGLFVQRTTGGVEEYRLFVARRTAHHEVPGGVLYEERSDLVGVVGYERNPVRRFFGIGPDTRAEDETNYTDENAALAVGWSSGLPHPDSDLDGSLMLRLVQRNTNRGIEPEVTDTADVHPGLLAAADRSTLVWAMGSLGLDGRDSSANPYSGSSIRVGVNSAWDDTGNVGGIATATTVLAISVPGLFHDGGAADRAVHGPEENPPTDVLAFGAQVSQAWGSLPFPDLPALGGSDTLRGYLADRFTDEAAWHAAAEWRLWFLPRGVRFTEKVRLERLGVAPFVDVGSVAPTLGRLPAAAVHHSVGAGLRFMLQRDLLFRLDIARSPEQVGVNFQFGYSF